MEIIKRPIRIMQIDLENFPMIKQGLLDHVINHKVGKKEKNYYLFDTRIKLNETTEDEQSFNRLMFRVSGLGHTNIMIKYGSEG